MTPLRAGLRRLALMAALVAAPPSVEAGGAPNDEAVCPVCAVREGTRAPEPVRAVREIDGVRYGFCSSACAAAFDRDPDLYRVPGAAAGAESLHVAPLVDFGVSRTATAPT